MSPGILAHPQWLDYGLSPEKLALYPGAMSYHTKLWASYPVTSKISLTSSGCSLFLVRSFQGLWPKGSHQFALSKDSDTVYPLIKSLSKKCLLDNGPE